MASLYLYPIVFSVTHRGFFVFGFDGVGFGELSVVCLGPVP
jgi:hypothetical protein